MFDGVLVREDDTVLVGDLVLLGDVVGDIVRLGVKEGVGVFEEDGVCVGDDPDEGEGV